MNRIRFCFPNFILLASIVALFFSCKKEKDQKDIPNAIFYKNIELAEQNLKNSNYQKAFQYYFVAKESCSAKENNRIVYALNEMAEIQRKQNDFSGCETTTTEALKICQNPVYLQRIYNTFGLCYLEQNDFSNSLKYYKKSLKVTENETDKKIIKNNIGYLFLKSQQYNKTINLLKPVSIHDSLKNNYENYAAILDNLGYAYFKTNNPIAIDYLNQSLKIRDSLKDDYSKIASYIHLSEYYQNSNTLLANEYAQKAYKTANATNSPDDRMEALKFLIQNSNPVEAKKLAIIQMNLADSINKVRKTARNEFAKIKYDSKKANLSSAKYKRQKETLLLILFITIAFATLIYFLIRSKNKNKLIKNTYNTETRIAKKLHDELANDVYHALTFAESQDLQNPDKKETLLKKLDTIYSRTRNISKENDTVETDERYPEILKDMISSYNNNQTQVIVNNFSTIEWNNINTQKKITLFRVVNELLVNMKKHSNCTIAILSFENTTKTLEINYSDNGKGCAKEKFLKKGLQNVENRILVLKGTITFDTNKGFKSKISIPI